MTAKQDILNRAIIHIMNRFVWQPNTDTPEEYQIFFKTRSKFVFFIN